MTDAIAMAHAAKSKQLKIFQGTSAHLVPEGAQNIKIPSEFAFAAGEV